MNVIDSIREAAQRRRRYNRLISEIEGLSDREAADIGISRHDARRIAHRTVYGG